MTLAAVVYALALPVLFFLIVFSLPRATAQDNPNCHEWGIAGGIPVPCCCSNDCCREAPATEFENIGNDNYRSTVTGQIVKRTGWSAGGFVKCACDFIDGKWTKHPGANIRCLFVPMPSS